MSERKAVIKNADMTVRAFSQHDPNTRAHECIDYFVIPLHNKSTLLHLFPHLFSWQFGSHWCSSIDLVCRTTCSRTQSTAQCTPSTSTTLRRFVLPPCVIRAILHLRLRCRELTYGSMRCFTRVCDLNTSDLTFRLCRILLLTSRRSSTRSTTQPGTQLLVATSAHTWLTRPSTSSTFT